MTGAHSCLAAAALCALFLADPVAAKPLPSPDRPLRLVAQDMPIADFLQQLSAPISATLSPKITGSISGVFEGKLDRVLSKVGKAFGADYYYDGQTIAFYPVSERVVQAFSLSSAEAQRVRVQAQRDGLIDSEDTLQVDEGRLTATGAQKFVALVQALVRHPVTDLPAAESPASDRSARGQKAAEDPVEYRVFHLRYGWAADTKISAGDRVVTIPGVATILRALVSGAGQEAEPDDASKVASKPATQQGLAGSGLVSTNQAGDGPGAPAANTLAGLFGLAASRPVEPRREPEIEPAKSPTSEFRVEADPRLNAVIVRDTRAKLALYERLIAELDEEPILVQIEATIIDVDVERARQSGFNLSFSQSNGSSFTSSLDGVLPSFPQAGGLSISAVVGDKNEFIAKLEALESRGAARIVSSPLIMTLSDVEASFTNDQTFYVPVNGSLSTDLYNVTAGTDLRVTPHVMRDKAQDRIRLVVEIDDGSVSSQLVGAIPVVQKASLSTEALILSGQSLLVGGMVSQNDADYHASVPGVASVPVLGQLFRASRKSSDHTERLFLITPRLDAVGAPAVPPAGSQELTARAENGALAPPPPESKQ